MYKILIVEDEKNARKILRSYLEELTKEIEIYEASNGEEAKELLSSNEFTLFFLDIKLPDFSGLDVAKYIRSMARYRLTPIVMLTSMIYFQQEAFKKYHVYDFFEKPYKKVEIHKTVLNILEGVEEQNHSATDSIISIQNKQGLFKLRLNQLLYVESVGRKKIFHTYDYTYEVPRMTMDQVMELLPKHRFLQVHKSFLVNIYKVDQIDQTKKSTWYIRFDNNSEVPVSDKYKEALIDVI